MTPIFLIDKMVEFIKPIAAEFELDTNVPGVKKAPQVIAGYLKEKKPPEQQNPPDLPYDIVR